MASRLVLLAALLSACAPAGRAQQAPSPADIEERFRRLEEVVAAQARRIEHLTDENRRLAERVESPTPSIPPLPSPTAPADDDDPAPPLPGPDDAPTADDPRAGTPPDDDAGTSAAGGGDSGGDAEEWRAFSAILDAGNDSIPEPDLASTAPRFLTGLYDKGYVIVAPHDKQVAPFSLKVNLTSQVRYTGFGRSVESWTDSTGAVLPVRNRSFFALNRNWFSFTGFAFSPRLRYNLTSFSTSATNQTLAFGSVGYEFNEAFILSGGYYKVPGTREWIESSRYPLGADRTLANTFFRPGISSGVWAQGELPRRVYYYAGVFDDLSSEYASAQRINTNMTYAANAWWEPLGSFGPGYSDEEWHEDAVLRLGSSVVYHRSLREPNLELGQTNPENTILRLSDGTPIYTPGALAPGVTLQAASVFLLSNDVSFKYRGFSLSAEAYSRWLYDFEPRGPRRGDEFPDIFNFGGLAQGSYALIPRRFELFARTSGVFGRAGDGSEYGGGANWHPYSNRNIRATFEVKRINHSPANNVLYGYYAGESGTLFQMQVLTDF